MNRLPDPHDGWRVLTSSDMSGIKCYDLKSRKQRSLTSEMADLERGRVLLRHRLTIRNLVWRGRLAFHLGTRLRFLRSDVETY